MSNHVNFDSEKFTNFFNEFPIPENSPIISDKLIIKLKEISKSHSKINIIFENIELSWLDPKDNRLGVTIFSDDFNELTRKKRLRLPFGKIKIKLHPILIDDEKLYDHTLVHELLHASGIIEHSDEHHRLTNEIAPSPSFSESSVLRYLQAVMISTTEVLSWDCSKCGYIWTRNTLIKPKKCPKCDLLLE
ncbi:MAG: hypothetical protein CMB64_03565 [Euryarchaeota archaeon]|nr:hypothetical protein [Euryarchaeota archaeon]